MQGGSAEGISGVIYALNSKVEISGSASSALNLNASIVANQVELSGNGTINFAYDASTAPSSLEPAAHRVAPPSADARSGGPHPGAVPRSGSSAATR